MQFPSQLPHILSLSDLYLTPLYILLLFFIVRKMRKAYYPHDSFARFIMPCFWVHVAATVFFALVLQYYYGYGDAYGYFTGAHEIWQAFLKDPGTAFELIFVSRDAYSEGAIAMAPYTSFPYFAITFSTVIRIAGFVSLFCFGSYIPIALVFTMFSFWGTWLIFITINKYFPHLFKFTGVATLFIPSVILWSSGISKEPPCMFALGLLFFCTDKILNKDRILRHIFLAFIGSWLLLYTKNYIFYTYCTGAVIWVYYHFVSRIASPVVKFSFKFIIFSGILAFFLYFFLVPDNPVQLSFMTGLTKGETLQELMTQVNEAEGGAAYTLPPFELSVWGFVRSFFTSLNVTLFRPYVWEIENVLMILSALESSLILLLVLLVIFKGRLGKIPALVRQFPIVIFLLAFPLIFSPIVGFISFNFGTLVRYKIPALPFLVPLLFILLAYRTSVSEGDANEKNALVHPTAPPQLKHQ